MSIMILNKLLNVFSWLIIAGFFGYICWLVLGAIASFREQSVKQRALTSAFSFIVFAGLALFPFAQARASLRMLVSALIGLGAAGLAFDLSRRRPLVSTARVLLVVPSTIVMIAAVVYASRSNYVMFDLYGLVGQSAVFIFLGSLLFSTIVIVPSAHMKHKVLLAVSWLMIVLGQLFLFRSLLMLLIFPGIAGLYFVLPSSGLYIMNGATARSASIALYAMVLFAAAIIVGLEGSAFFSGANLYLFSWVTLLIVGCAGIWASYFRVRRLLVWLALLWLVVGTFGAAGTSVAWPLPPLVALFLISSFSVNQIQEN